MKLKGLALCCGQAPLYHPWHKSSSGAHGQAFICDKCGKTVSVIGDLRFAAKNWNISFGLEPELDAPKGWRYAELNAEHHYMGGKDNLGKAEFVLFYTRRKDILHSKDGFTCVIDAHRLIKTIEFMTIYGEKIKFPKLSKGSGCHIYATAVNILGGKNKQEKYYGLELISTNQRWKDEARELMAKIHRERQKPNKQ